MFRMFPFACVTKECGYIRMHASTIMTCIYIDMNRQRKRIRYPMSHVQYGNMPTRDSPHPAAPNAFPPPEPRLWQPGMLWCEPRMDIFQHFVILANMVYWIVSLNHNLSPPAPEAHCPPGPADGSRPHGGGGGPLQFGCPPPKPSNLEFFGMCFSKPQSKAQAPSP